MMNKRLAVGFAFSAALSINPAFAADLYAIKGPPPPPAPPPPIWGGFYVGLNAGGTWSEYNRADVVSTIISGGVPSEVGALGTATIPVGRGGAFIGGGQVGYNWQFATIFVAGVEADIQGVAGSGGGGIATTAGLIAGGAVPLITTLSSSNRLDYLGTVRGRVGWLFTPTLLIYGTGGLAYGGVSSITSTLQVAPTVPAFGFGSSSFSDTRVGWTAGGGLEWMFWPNWSAKVEYLYYDLGSARHSAVLVTDPGPYAISQTSTRFNGHIVRAGVNYHFNWSAPPVVASY